jgi:Flp pilus assembly protein TadD
MTSLRKSAAALLAGVILGAAGPAAGQGPARTPQAPAARKERRDDPLAALLRQAEDAIEKKDFAAAVPPLERYVAERPDDATAHFHLGYVYSALERWDAAKSEYARAIALNPKLAAAHLNLGLVLLDHDPAAAVEPLQQAAELLPDQSRPRFLLALALERAGKPARAIEEYEAAERLDPKSYEIRFALGRALLAGGRAADAEPRFRQALALRGNSAPARLGLAESLRLQDKQEAAAAAFAAYLELQPQDRDARRQRAALLADVKRYDEALAELDRSEAAGPPALAGAKLRAEIYLQQKQWTEAADALQKALGLAPQDAELHARLGRVWLEKRDFAAAERELRQALQLDRGLTDALRDLMDVYYLNQNCAATLTVLDLLAQREPPTAGSWFVRATCYDRVQRKEEAVAAYQKFLALDQGRNDNQDFQARQRIRILTRELQKKKR